MTDVLLPNAAALAHAARTTLGARAKSLLAEQRIDFPLARRGYDTLSTVLTRSFDFDAGFAVKVQFNPGRMASSSAKVDPKSIAERKCFLCPAHLPAEQRGVPFADDYLVLVNPFPIFPEHFTVASLEHIPQRITDTFDAMLDLALEIGPDLTTFYNGPKCGASAPDHFHFQAGTFGFMPVDAEYDAVKRTLGQTLVENATLRAYAVDHDYLRPFIGLESADPELLGRAFSHLYEACRATLPGEEEAMLNVLCSHDGIKWRVVTFPRRKHRPSFYFAEGDARILLSPAAVEYGGVCTTPVQRDFERVNRDHLVTMFAECSADRGQFAEITRATRAALTAI